MNGIEMGVIDHPVLSIFTSKRLARTLLYSHPKRLHNNKT